MGIWNSIVGLTLPYLPLLSMIIAISSTLLAAHWILIRRHEELGNERMWPRQIAMLGLTLVTLVALVLVLPVSEGTRNRLLGIIGLLISGILAFSSTNVVANLMAGILLRVTKPFRTGDFIRVGDHFGRVSERGLFETEIQSESRELIAIPNTYLASHPVTTIRSSGTIIATTLSLGYDVHHAHVEPLLLQAAKESGLEEPFVHILELGNYAITYRISGFLPEIKWLITARSNLCRSVLDILHDQGIEIMSPTYMNQRPVNDAAKIIPTSVQKDLSSRPVIAEDIVFDKAEQAEQSENEKQKLINDMQELETALKEAPEEEKKRIKDEIAEGRERLKLLEQTTEELSAKTRIAEPDSSRDTGKGGGVGPASSLKSSAK
ncbi:MAG: mechanosensitive ion channel family protein [Proteobacteria bacterium]|jgi:small-conductance mechanosensitive channel|nr:mechanosensitive ion channel [Desulfocapsa sp.]MBU3945372.1 mechanosensitive ion channel family protein [Pseudomonadota bacterium]MCG2743320.1 mechanosensitive ion channel family protein [Desulfobacteraceae bacterium]MBU3982635.1 mechanosensitive ion channel family protein [Pseudomonadota bacterium]MBU4029355.1 mechanosensitive ion channel family protein [Pseudomonadota bacterium]